MAARNRNALAHLSIQLDSDDELKDLTDEEKQLETRRDAVRCPDCLATIHEDRIKENWCINCTQEVHPHPTGKDIEDRSRLENRFWEKVDIREPDQCWPWKFYSERYGRFWLSSGYALAHRVAYMLHHDLESLDDIPDDVVKHRCHNTLCCNHRHLRAGTQSENLKEACTEGDRETRFTDVEVREIRRQYNDSGRTQKEIGDRFDVSHALISGIVRGEYYSWVD